MSLKVPCFAHVQAFMELQSRMIDTTAKIKQVAPLVPFSDPFHRFRSCLILGLFSCRVLVCPAGWNFDGCSSYCLFSAAAARSTTVDSSGSRPVSYWAITLCYAGKPLFQPVICFGCMGGSLHALLLQQSVTIYVKMASLMSKNFGFLMQWYCFPLISFSPRAPIWSVMLNLLNSD